MSVNERFRSLVVAWPDRRGQLAAAKGFAAPAIVTTYPRNVRAAEAIGRQKSRRQDSMALGVRPVEGRRPPSNMKLEVVASDHRSRLGSGNRSAVQIDFSGAGPTQGVF